MSTQARIGIFVDFTRASLLRLETIDTRLFAHPYGPKYNDAVGRLYKIRPGGAGPDDSELTLGYVKSITPNLPERWFYPLEVIEQSVNPEGNVVLVARIRHQRGPQEIRDIHSTEGKKLIIEVYGDSAKTLVRIDDADEL